MEAMNKRLLISESRGDSNRCTPCRGKPDQHNTYASHTSPRTPRVRFLRAVPVHGNPSRVINRVGRMHCSREKCSRLNLSAQLSGPWDPPQFLSQHSHWTSALKPSTCWQQTTRLTGHISPACNWHVQYMLTGTNSSVLNRHRRGLPHRKPQNSHSTLPALPF
jgi:transposase